MTGLTIAREALWPVSNERLRRVVGEIFGDLPEEAAEAPASKPKPSRFPASVAHLPAFSQPINVHLLEIGMDRTEHEYQRMQR